MKNRSLLTVPNILEYWKPIKAYFNQICQIVDFPKKEAKELEDALYELFENSVIHAYQDEEGTIEITFEIYENGIRIDVRDEGIPIDPNLIQTVPLKLKKKNKGFNRVYNLVDEFKFFNLGMKGKKFSIIKHTPLQLKLKEDIPFYSDILEDFDKTDRAFIKEKLNVRYFRPEDEVWIPKLIYKNYGYTYFKDTFYYPKKILELEKSGKIASIVAEVDQKIVGHFALVRVENSNIAEVGIAVVDPTYKGLGIMKEMFKLLIQKAKEMDLDALFGEAITFHPYSQRANAQFGFYTTALMLGDIHHIVKLKNHPYPFREKRGTVAVEYKLLKTVPKNIFLPHRYANIIKKTYNNCKISFNEKKVPTKEKTKISLEYNHSFNIATIVINTVDKEFSQKFKMIFEKAIAKHVDMIYADINLEEIVQIDEVVAELRDYRFFYSGILFLRRLGRDYLRMQFEASENIEEKNIVCYSDFCKELHRFILEDKKL